MHTYVHLHRGGQCSALIYDSLEQHPHFLLYLLPCACIPSHLLTEPPHIQSALGDGPDSLLHSPASRFSQLRRSFNAAPFRRRTGTIHASADPLHTHRATTDLPIIIEQHHYPIHLRPTTRVTPHVPSSPSSKRTSIFLLLLPCKRETIPHTYKRGENPPHRPRSLLLYPRLRRPSDAVHV